MTRYKLINDQDVPSFDEVGGTEIREPVSKAALLLDEHITEKRPKYGTVRDKFDVHSWFYDRVDEGYDELEDALMLNEDESAIKDLPLAKRKALNFFTRAYYVLLLLDELGEGE